MFRSACDFLAGKAGLDVGADNASDEDSSKENSIINGQTPSPTKGTPVSAGAPWGHTLTPKTGGQVQAQGKPSQQRLVLNNSSTSASTPKQNVPWSDLSFAAEVVSPGFASRVVREAHNHNTRSPVESRRQYPTAQERYVRAGVLPNVRLGGRTKAVLTPRRTPTSPLLPLGRSSSSTFSSSLSSDFLTSSTPRMPDIRSVASVLEPANSSNECVRDPTSVQAVVAALQQAQVGKGIKRGSCYMEPEDLSKRQKCSTAGSMGSTSMPINYSRDFLEEEQNCGSNSTGSGGGEKRALDLSPGAQGSPWQLSPENKKRCIPDPMIASFSSSKHILDLEALQTSGRDTPYSMYDSRRDTDSESNPSVESGQTKNSDQSLHQQTSEATGGESCVISPGPSERDPSDRSGSHTPQSTRGESCNSSGGGGQGGTTNTSRTSTPRNPTPPRPTHVISLEAYKAEKVKSQQRLKKMLDMLFHIKESDEPRSSKSGESTPSGSGSAFSLATVTPAVESSATSLTLSSAHGATPETLQTTASSVPTPATGGFGTLISSDSLFMSKTTEEDDMPSPSGDQTTSEGSKNEISASFTFSLKSANTSVTSKDSESGSKGEELTKGQNDGDNDVSVTAVLKLPASSSSDAAAKVSAEDATTLSGPGQEKSSDAPASSPLVDFLKSSTSVKDGTISDMPLNRNPLLCSKTPTQVTSTSAEPNQIPGISPLTFTSSAPVNQGNTGIFTVGQTSAPTSQVTSVATPSAFSVALPQAVTSVSNFFSHSVPQTANSAVTLSTVENAQSSSLTSLSFGSNNNDKSAGFQQSNNEGTSGSSNSLTGNGVSGFFNNTSNAAKLTVTSQGGLDVPATLAEEPSTAPTADPTAVDSGVSLGNPSSTANSLTANQGDIDTETSVPNVGSSTLSSTNPSSVMSSGFFSSTPSIAKTSAISQGGLDALMTTSAVGSFSAPSSNPSTVMSSGFFSSTSSTAKSSATSQGGLDSPMTTSTEGLPTAPSTNPSAGLFTFGSGNNMLTPQQSSFTFLDPKKTTSSVDSTTGSAAPVLGFSFGTSQASNSATLPFGSTGVTQTSIPATSSGFSSGLTFGSQTGSVAPSVTAPSPFGASTASVTAPPGNATTAVAATTQASPFSFGQSTTGLPTTTASASPFTFGSSSTHGVSGTSSVFQFGGATASATTGTGTPPQPFAPAVVSTQSSTTASSLFTFGTPGTTTATSVATTTTPSGVTPSLFTFGLPKTNTTAPTFGTTTNASAPTFGTTTNASAPTFGTTTNASAPTFGTTTNASAPTFGTTTNASAPTFGTTTNASAPTFGTTTNASVKAAPSSGFGFGSTTAAASTTSAPSAGFTFGSSVTTPASGFPFGAASKSSSTDAKSSSPFTFGNTENKTPNFGAGSSSPFSFGGNTSAAPAFGSNPSQGFGALTTSAPTFGISTPSFGTATGNPTSPFGSANTFGATSPNSSFSFGAAASSNKTNNGANLFGVQGSTPSFGAANNPAPPPDNLVLTGTGGFSSTQNPAFGTPTFGSDNAAASKGAAFQFGQGTSNPPSFGAAATSPTFRGATNPPTFGGATNPSTFGGGASATGASSGPVFQFGTTGPPPFNTGNNPFSGNNPSSNAPRRPRARVRGRNR